MNRLRMMLIFAVACMSLLTPCWAEEPYPDEDLRVLEGTVTAIDTSKSTLTVSGGVEIAFQISNDTKLLDGTGLADSDYDIKLSEINVGDYVTIKYVRKGQESRVPYKVLKVVVEEKKKAGIMGEGGWRETFKGDD